jgi:Metallo-beta-lactamase superfamily
MLGLLVVVTTPRYSQAMASEPVPSGEILDGLWQFFSVHPEWDADDDDWWQPEVAWWVVRTPVGAVLIDPLVEDWDALDRLVASQGGCAAIIRTTYWHERSIPQARERYATAVWAQRARPEASATALDHAVADGQELPGGLVGHHVVRDDEIAVWLPAQRALAFGDVMVREAGGTLRICPDSWIERDGGPARLRATLAALPDLELEHVLVAHGPLVLGDGRDAFARALAG